MSKSWDLENIWILTNYAQKSPRELLHDASCGDPG